MEFLFFISAFCINQYLQFIEINNDFVTSYVDDILCIPIVLYISLFVMKFLNDETLFSLSFLHISSSVVFFHNI